MNAATADDGMPPRGTVLDRIRARARLRTRFVRRGGRTVLLTSDSIRFGNYLYFALHAHAAAQRGEDYRVLDSGLGQEYYDAFPRLAPLMVHEVRVRDRREPIPDLFDQAYGRQFTVEQLERFIRDVLLTGPVDSYPTDHVTVNVRRGDYYSRPDYIEYFGIDVPAYVRAALSLAAEDGPINQVVVVSDDVNWAAQAVRDAGVECPCEPVQGGPLDDFAALVRSPRLILANSTFSYWGGYVSDVVHGRASVYAPDLHSRAVLGGKPYQHAPWWTAVPVRPGR